MLRVRGIPITPRTACAGSNGLYEKIRLYFHAKRFGSPALASRAAVPAGFVSVSVRSVRFDCSTAPSAPRSQRLPVIKRRLDPVLINRLTVKRQLFGHLPQRERESSVVSAASASDPSIPDDAFLSAPISCH